MKLRLGFLFVCVCAFGACKDSGKSQSRGPIVLGDSSTIITETNPEVLQDLVPDLQPVVAATNNDSTVVVPPAKDAPAAASTPVAAPSGPALVAAFKEVTITIPGIDTKVYGKQDLQKARSATFELRSGNLDNTSLKVSGGTVTKVTARYQTELMVVDGSDKLPLETLGNYSSNWETVSGNNGRYPIALAASKLDYKELSASAIRSAVQHEARRKRLNRKDMQDWLETVRKVKSVNDAPMVIVLRSAMWRIEGKDAGGKAFSKELRIDVPR